MMKYWSLLFGFFKRWFMPMPAHDDMEFDPAAEAEPERQPAANLDVLGAAAAASAANSAPAEVAPEPVEQPYGQPVVDPAVAEGLDAGREQEEYDPSSDRDFAPGEPAEREQDEREVKKVDPLPVHLPEGAEARESRSPSRVNPFEQE